MTTQNGQMRRVFHPKYAVTVIIGLLAPVITCHVNAEIRWISTTCELGVIKEEEGKVEGKFEFVNESEYPTFLTEVRPSCGCTVAQYSNSVIEPGDTAVISFVFNPAGRPGTINKSIRVGVESERRAFNLKIDGKVKASEPTLEFRYPYDKNGLRFDTSTLLAGEIPRRAKRVFVMDSYNNSADTIFFVKKELPETIKIEYEKDFLEPWERGEISVLYNSAVEEEEGIKRYKLPLTFKKGNEGEEEVYEFNFIADVKPVGDY